MKCNVADFYCGAVLSTLLNDGMTPVLIENGKRRRIYNLTTNDNDIIAIIKYCRANREVKSMGSTRWMFNLKDDISVIESYLEVNRQVVMYLVCAREKLQDSKIVKVNTKNLINILNSKKKSITVGIEKNKRNYIIYMSGSSQKDILIKCNSI